METIAILLISFIGTFLSSLSGGGSSIIIIPAFLAMGISFPMATAAQKVSAIFWVPVAARNYLKEKAVDWKFLLLFAGIGLVGAYFGVKVVLTLDRRIVEIVIGVIIFALVFHTALQKQLGLIERVVESRLKKAMAYPFALLLGFYETFFGSANGILFAQVVFHTRGFDMIKALGYYFAAAFFWVFFAAMLLIQKGYFDISIMAGSHRFRSGRVSWLSLRTTQRQSSY